MPRNKASSQQDIAKKIINHLKVHGTVEDASGGANALFRNMFPGQENLVTMVTKHMADSGIIERDTRGKRTYRITLVDPEAELVLPSNAAGVTTRTSGAQQGGERAMGHAVNRYLAWCEQNLQRSRDGRGVQAWSVEKLSERVKKLTAAMAGAPTPIKRLNIAQEVRDLERLIEQKSNTEDVESPFVAVAKEYGEKHGIQYATWRAFGVDADVLAKAGIQRG